MIVLFDYDSLIYKSVYKIVDYQIIKQWFKQGKTKTWMSNEILNHGINRLCNMHDNIFTEIENTGIEIESVEYFITYAKNSLRKKISPIYKNNRKPNKWVNAIRKYLIDANFAHTSDTLEADDLIAERSKVIGESKCIILSLDKDMNQIPGVHFNYYRPKVIDANGNKVSGDMVGLSMITKDEANYNFWVSMLAGDSGDRIEGIKGIGKVKACNILHIATNLEETVKNKYMQFHGESWEYHYSLNFRLLKLGNEAEIM